MPTCHLPEDSDAQKVYEELGYKVIPIQSIIMSDWHSDSVHYQTMAYPPMKLGALLKSLHVKEYK
jgi:hypothetical protein